jgi:hypothetical protein
MTDRLDRVMAYLDGELDPAARQAFEAEISADRALAAEVEAHRTLATALSAAYDPVLHEPVPPRLELAAWAANDAPRRIGGLIWGALAASLVVGLLVGRLVLTPPPPRLSVGATVPARHLLAAALDRQLAAEPGAIRIGLTYRDLGGRYCRTFQSSRDRLAGLACRDGSAWRLKTATAWSPTPGPAYRTAASAMPPEVVAAVDRTLGGDTFDAAQEKAARDRGWR